MPAATGDRPASRPRPARGPAPDAVGFLDAVDGADVRMIQCGEHPRFALEARQPLRVARERMPAEP